jgi:outer membrane protein assembly factor BamB
MIYASPFVMGHGRIVIIGSTDGCLRLLNAQTGEMLCETQLNDSGLFSSPICYQNFLIIGSRDDHLYCYQLL